MIDTFTPEEFQVALPANSKSLGIQQGEYVYYLPVDDKAGIMVRSSIHANGASADTGKDSIRLWLTTETGMPLAGKLDEYTTRVPGWQRRIGEKITRLTAIRLSAGDCRTCKQPRHIYVSNTERNPGRMFAKCPEHNEFKWLDVSETLPTQVEGFERVIVAKRQGKCPWCYQIILPGDEIGLREGQWGHTYCEGKPQTTTLIDSAPERDCSADDIAETLTITVSTVATPVAIAADTEALLSDDPSALADTLTTALQSLSVAEEEPTPTPPKSFTPSKYQLAIFDFVKDGQGNGVIEAVAGSGKTTTLLKALEYTPHDASVVFLAFNKHIATELKNRAPEHVEVRTLHSLGFFNLRDKFGNKLTVDEDKLEHIMDEWLPVDRRTKWETRVKNRATRGVLRKLCGLVKAVSLDWHTTVSSPATLEELADRYGVEVNGEFEEATRLIPKVLQEDLDTANKVIDYDDMIWIPIALNMKLRKYDFLFIDEAQDLNATQIEFVLRSIKPGGRIVAVGDRWQSLYGFRGADTEAIPNLIRALDATTLPLSITYRCPQKHVARAKEIVPEIEARENAPDGVLESIAISHVMRLAKVGDMIVCRTNALLVPLAFELIRSGIKAVVRGRDIGKGLIQLLDRFQANTITELDTNLTEYLQYESERLRNREKLQQLQQLEDRVETLRAVMSHCTTIGGIKDKLESLFSDEQAGVTLSSIHRAKGLEAERVFFLHPEMIPLKYAVQGWQLQQEYNCMYVALTRSKSELYLVS